MIKIKTLFLKNPEYLSLVLDGQLDPDNAWVYDDGVKAYHKFDGTTCAIINGELYKRYDAKHGKTPPKGAIPCQEPDIETGHWPHWVKCDRNNKGDKYHFEAFDRKEKWEDGTYELIGPKVQGNPEKIEGHILFSHKGYYFYNTHKILENPKEFMKGKDIEGIVFHHPDGRMCKIRKKDFGMKRRD